MGQDPHVPQKSKTTIKDVARAAGCGIATASRVLNRSGPASPDTRARVEQAARDLGFSFSAAGRALRSSRSMTVGCLVPSLANPVFADAVQGVQQALAGEGYQVLIASSDYDHDGDNEALSTLIDKDVDALIVTMVAPERSAALRRAAERGVPVCLMFHDPVAGYPSAYVDNFEAAREVARRFAALGHQRTAFVALRFASSDRSRNRYAGFADECARLGLAAPALIELSARDAARPDVLAAELARHPALTAVFASNDFLAIALQRAAPLLGWQVPDDLSVVGFDGIAIGRLLDRPLATVETAPDQMGRLAAGHVLQMMQGDAPSVPAPLPATFRAGATLAAPRAESRDDDQVAPRSPSVLSFKRDLKQG